MQDGFGIETKSFDNTEITVVFNSSCGVVAALDADIVGMSYSIYGLLQVC